MKYQLQQNLGLDDAKYCNDHLGAKLSAKAGDLESGQTIELPEAAVTYLTVRKGYTALLEPAGKITGEAKKPEITAPSKQ